MQVRKARGQAAEHSLGFQSCESGTEAEMGAITESHMAVLGAHNIEPIRLRELSRVMVCRPNSNLNPLTFF